VEGDEDQEIPILFSIFLREKLFPGKWCLWISFSFSGLSHILRLIDVFCAIILLGNHFTEKSIMIVQTNRLILQLTLIEVTIIRLGLPHLNIMMARRRKEQR
jgi:hypothetical protein